MVLFSASTKGPMSSGIFTPPPCQIERERRTEFQYALAPMAEDAEWIDVEAAARYLNFHPNTVYRIRTRKRRVGSVPSRTNRHGGARLRWLGARMLVRVADRTGYEPPSARTRSHPRRMSSNQRSRPEGFAPLPRPRT